MEAISVHGAKEGQPFTLKHDGTVAGLHAALTQLMTLGYGGTAVHRCDYEAGLTSTFSLELYDVSKEHERGELASDMTFLIC